jgi:hypothetical protein
VDYRLAEFLARFPCRKTEQAVPVVERRRLITTAIRQNLVLEAGYLKPGGSSGPGRWARWRAAAEKEPAAGLSVPTAGTSAPSRWSGFWREKALPDRDGVAGRVAGGR